MTKTRKKLFAGLGVGLAVSGLLLTGTGPVHSVGTITLNGSASGQVGIFGSPFAEVTNNSLTGGTAQIENDSPSQATGNFTGEIDFGTLSAGDGLDSVGTVGLRVRGNQKCRVNCSVSAYSATDIVYNPDGTTPDPLDDADASSLTMIMVQAAEAAAHGDDGDADGLQIGTQFQDGDVALGSLNGGIVAPQDDETATAFFFTKKPSMTGNLGSPDNWVQTNVSFAVPTGFAWAPADGETSGSFSASVQFGIWPGDTNP